MEIIEFYSDVFLPNAELYALCLILMCIPALFIYKQLRTSIIDPLAIQLFSAIFANVIPVFLFITGNCSEQNFWYFVFSESCFWLGIVIFVKRKSSFLEKELQGERIIEQYLFVYFTVIFFLIQAFTYIEFGIPAFMMNRNQVYAGSGGYGILAYIKHFPSLYMLMYIMDKILRKRIKKIYIIILILYFLTLLLDGSRGSILQLFYIYFFYYAFYLKRLPKIKLKYLAIVPLFAVAAISFQARSEGSSVLAFGERVVAFGDVYYFAYPNEVINTIKLPDPILHLLSPILRPFRIVDYTLDQAMPIGSKVLYAMNPQYEVVEIMSAPNSRIPVSTWIYFRWPGVLFSFCVGLFISFILFKARAYFHHTILGISCFSFIYLKAVSGCTDLGMLLGSFFSIFMSFFLLAIFVLLLTGGRIVVKRIVKCKIY